MAKVRGNPADKWVRRASQSTNDYSEGVANPRRSWQTATVAAAAAQAQGVQQAIQQKRFEKGVQAAGEAKWQNRAQQVGSERYAGGVAAGQSDYAQNVQPFFDVIDSTQLPPRGPKGDPRTIERVKVLNDALRRKKLSLG